MADEQKTPDTTETPKEVELEHVARPNKDELDKRVGAIEREIEDLKAKQESLHEFRKAATAGGPKTGPLADARAAFKVLSDKARAIREERKGYFDAMAAAKAAREKMVRGHAVLRCTCATLCNTSSASRRCHAPQFAVPAYAPACGGRASAAAEPRLTAQARRNANAG